MGGRAVSLTPTEYRLLVELATNAGKLLTRGHLPGQVRGPGHTEDYQLLRTFIRNLRSKLGDDAARPKYILTEPRMGYRISGPQG